MRINLHVVVGGNPMVDVYENKYQQGRCHFAAVYTLRRETNRTASTEQIARAKLPKLKASNVAQHTTLEGASLHP